MRVSHASVLPFAFAAALMPLALQAAEPTVDYDAEINRLRRELAQVSEERQRNRQEMAKDQQEIKAYNERTRSRFERLRRETDSLRQQVSALGMKNNGLSAQVSAAQARQRQIELQQDNYRLVLVAACDSVDRMARRLPPMVSRQISASVTLLKTELSARSVDNIEGCSRLQQIMTQIEEATGSIQVVQESSPVPEIRGTAYRLRVGGLFEGVVDLKGTTCALWSGYNADGTPSWRQGDAAMAANLLKAANVREGKALPAMVELPLARDEKGGVR